jgi:hypothetical protein
MAVNREGEMIKNGTLQIEGTEYRWMIHRQPNWTSEGLVGMAILVTLTQPNTRELLLEFAMESVGHHCMPSHQRFKVSKKRVIQCIQNAIAAGWNPHERGKKFVFLAPALQSSN